MIRCGTANFGITGTGRRQKVNRSRLRNDRVALTCERMKAHDFGLMLCIDGENARDFKDTMTAFHPWSA